PVGAAFTPVRKVNYTTEPTRRGSRIDLERLVMEIWTNGTVSPREALGEAARILVNDYLSLFLEFGLEEREAPSAPGGEEILVEKLGFSVRTYNCLKKAGIQTLRDLLAKTEDDLLQIRNFGKKALMEIREKLAGLGYELERSNKSVQDDAEEAEEEEQTELQTASEDKDGED
ncbi:MAG: DNA-directed RNA polymerase subunit alpha C-terminal domain-containing protein, partial [Armatimonadota bacterium]